MTSHNSHAGHNPAGAPSLRIIGDADSHDTLRRVLADRQPAKILDVPSGHGVLAQFLLDRGWEVHCADIDAGNFQLEGVPFTQVNLNRAMAIESDSFDAIVTANGLHRLYNPGGAIHEFFRILRPGGSLFINVNNYASIDRRLRYLFSGSVNDAVNTGACRQTVDDAEAHVRIALVYPQLAGALEAAGFEIVNLQPAAVRWRHRLLLPLAWLVMLGSLFMSPATRRKRCVRQTNSRAILRGGGYFFVEARKPA